MRRYPGKKAVAVVLSNQNYGLLMPTPLVAGTVENILLGRPAVRPPKPVPKSEEWLGQCAGSYQIEGGGRLEVEVRSGALHISALGQPAVNLLTGRSAAEGERLQGLTQRARRLAKALQEGRFSQIAAIARAAGADSARSAALYQGWLEGLEKEHGPLQSMEVAGTIPQGESSRTYLEMAFQRSRQVRRLRRLDGQLVSIVPGGLPLVSTHFHAVSEDRLAGFHLAYARTVEAAIVRHEDGTVTALEFDGPEGKVVAQRR